MTHPLKTIIPLSIVCAVLIGYQYLGATWTEPVGTPPNNNVDAPVNVGSALQVKDGPLSVDGLAVFGDMEVSGTTTADRVFNRELCNETGTTCATINEILN
jgi:hypothetical protein